jgi:hypothetical protein
MFFKPRADIKNTLSHLCPSHAAFSAVAFFCNHIKFRRHFGFPTLARWRLIETNGVLFVLLKCRVQQKRHRPPHDKTSGLSFDTAITLKSKKTYTETPDEQAN